MIGKDGEYVGNQREIEVQILLSTGRTVQGKMVINGQRSFGQYLNAGPEFLEFKKMDGALAYFARAAIQQVWEHTIPTADQLKEAREKFTKEFDPYEILGVTEDSTYREVHQAYVKLAKAYHPDRYSSIGLPDEIRTYVQDMSKRINSAFSELEHIIKSTETAA